MHVSPFASPLKLRTMSEVDSLLLELILSVISKCSRRDKTLRLSAEKQEAGGGSGAKNGSLRPLPLLFIILSPPHFSPIFAQPRRARLLDITAWKIKRKCLLRRLSLMST